MNVPSGYSALDLVGFTDKGDYSASANYVKNDLVHYNDKIWKCLIDDTTGIAPTTGVNWDVWIDQSNSLDRLADVEITSPTDGQEVTYDATTQKWKNTSKIQTLTNQVKDMNNVYGAKNLLPYPYYENRSSLNGITWVINSDGSVTFNGTATADAYFNCTYINKIVDFGDINFGSRKPSDAPYIATLENGSSDVFLNYNASNKITSIAILSGTVCNNLTVYPMIRLASITDDTYEPYAKTNQQLTEDTTALLDNLEVNGAVNMLPNTATTQTVNGITYTVNSDGSITVNGTATGGNASLVVNMTTYLKKGTYKLTGAPEGYDNTTRLTITRGTPSNVHDNGNGALFTLTEDATKALYVQAIVWEGKTVSNLTFKPMITVASYNGTYVPYAKSNKELTEDVSVKTNTSGLASSVGTIQTQSFQTVGKITILTAQIKVGSSGCAKWSSLANWTNSDDTPCPVNTIRTAGYIWDNSAGEDRTIPLAVLPNGQIQPIEALAENDIVGFTISYIHS